MERLYLGKTREGHGNKRAGGLAKMSGFGVERTGWSHVHDANDPEQPGPRVTAPLQRLSFGWCFARGGLSQFARRQNDSKDRSMRMAGRCRQAPTMSSGDRSTEV